MPDAIPQLADRGWLLRRYFDDERTMVEIAAELGCTQPAVSKAFVRHGIEARSPGARVRAGGVRRPRAQVGCVATSSHWLRSVSVPVREALGFEVRRYEPIGVQRA